MALLHINQRKIFGAYVGSHLLITELRVKVNIATAFFACIQMKTLIILKQVFETSHQICTDALILICRSYN